MGAWATEEPPLSALTASSQRCNRLRIRLPKEVPTYPLPNLLRAGPAWSTPKTGLIGQAGAAELPNFALF